MMTTLPQLLATLYSIGLCSHPARASNLRIDVNGILRPLCALWVWQARKHCRRLTACSIDVGEPSSILRVWSKGSVSGICHSIVTILDKVWYNVAESAASTSDGLDPEGILEQAVERHSRWTKDVSTHCVKADWLVEEAGQTALQVGPWCMKGVLCDRRKPCRYDIITLGTWTEQRMLVFELFRVRTTWLTLFFGPTRERDCSTLDH